MPDCMRPRAGLLFRQPVPASGFQRPRGIFPDSGRLFHGPEQFQEQSVQTGLYASHSLSVLEYSHLFPPSGNHEYGTAGILMQPCRLPLPFHSRFYSSFHQWIDGRTLFPSHMVFEGYHSLFPHFPHPAEIEISGFCPDPDLLQHGLAPIPRAGQQDYPCSIHRLPVQSGPFPVFHQTG